MVGWLVGLVVGWVVGWKAGWLASWLVGWLVDTLWWATDSTASLQRCSLGMKEGGKARFPATTFASKWTTTLFPKHPSSHFHDVATTKLEPRNGGFRRDVSLGTAVTSGAAPWFPMQAPSHFPWSGLKWSRPKKWLKSETELGSERDHTNIAGCTRYSFAGSHFLACLTRGRVGTQCSKDQTSLCKVTFRAWCRQTDFKCSRGQGRPLVWTWWESLQKWQLAAPFSLHFHFFTGICNACQKRARDVGGLR